MYGILSYKQSISLLQYCILLPTQAQYKCFPDKQNALSAEIKHHYCDLVDKLL
jgi:hypothetical protein